MVLDFILSFVKFVMLISNLSQHLKVITANCIWKDLQGIHPLNRLFLSLIVKKPLGRIIAVYANSFLNAASNMPIIF